MSVRRHGSLGVLVLVAVITLGLWPLTATWAFDLSRSSVPREEILAGGPPKDGIPALTDPAVVAANAATYLQPDDRVLGVSIGSHARAYPIRLLHWHEVINDTLGELPIVGTYCPLCSSGLVFRAQRRGQRITRDYGRDPYAEYAAALLPWQHLLARLTDIK